jgi:beta-lactamase regulating signal transducer with metallopeptidase domain
MIAALCEHLWQSTLFAVAAWALTLALRNHRAGLRHWVWLVASVKFLTPFSLLVTLGKAMEFEPVASAREVVASAISIFTPLSTATIGVPLSQLNTVDVGAAFIWCWIVGSVVLALRWLRSWLYAQAVLRTATLIDVDAPLPVKTSSQPVEPGVVGILHPVLLLPSGMVERFSNEQLRAIVAHELCHVERHDNLKAAVHMLVEVLLWFHPFVWWIGARLLEERERACDEAVLDAGHQPAHYVEGVLNVCRLFHPCAVLGAAASGGNLKQRIVGILSARRPAELTGTQRTVLGLLALMTVIAPIAAGAMTGGKRHVAAPAPNAETLVLLAPDGSSAGDARRVHLISGTLRDLIGLAYDTSGSQIHLDAGWLDARPYRLEAASSVDPSTYRALLTRLLAERFNVLVYVNGHCQRPCGRNEQTSPASRAVALWQEQRPAVQIKF